LAHSTTVDRQEGSHKTKVEFPFARDNSPLRLLSPSSLHSGKQCVAKRVFKIIRVTTTLQ